MLRRLFCCLFGANKPVTNPPEVTPQQQQSLQTIVQSNDPILTQIQLFCLDFAPVGWLPCDGRELEITQNMALFALLGNKFGGDGIRNFLLPDLRGKEPVPNMMYCLCVHGVFPERSR